MWFWWLFIENWKLQKLFSKKFEPSFLENFEKIGAKVSNKKFIIWIVLRDVKILCTYCQGNVYSNLEVRTTPDNDNNDDAKTAGFCQFAKNWEAVWKKVVYIICRTQLDTHYVFWPKSLALIVFRQGAPKGRFSYTVVERRSPLVIPASVDNMSRIYIPMTRS